MGDAIKDIEGLLGHLVDGQQEYALLTSKSAHAYHAALIALLAERNALRERVAELEATSNPADRDLRERTDTMVRWMGEVTAMLCHSLSHSHNARQELVNRYSAAIAAMRKGNTDA